MQAGHYPPQSIAFDQAPSSTGEDDITVASAFAPAHASFQAAPAPVLNANGDVTVITQPPVYASAPPFTPTFRQDATAQSPGYASASKSPGNLSAPLAPTPTIREDGNISVVTPTATVSTDLVPRQQQRRQSFPPTTPSSSASNENRIVPFRPAGAQQPHKTYPDKVERMKIKRKRATVAAGVAGGVVGLLAAGPLGAIVVGAGGAAATRAIGKRRERKKREELAEKEIQKQAAKSPDVLVHSSSGLL